MFTWFDLAWPWIGLGFAVVLIVLLFATSVLRSEGPRWRDVRWLSFLAVAVYLVHNVEEYGLAANGVGHAFPDSLCELLGQSAYPACGIPPLFFLFVNLPLVWIAGPVAALLSRRFPLAGLMLWGVIAANAVVHIVPAIIRREYDPGLVTAVVLFVPLTLLVVAGNRSPNLLLALAAGVFLHVVLAGSLVLYLGGRIPEWLLLALQPAAIVAGYVALALRSRGRRGSP